jgi:hypothetical protein
MPQKSQNNMKGTSPSPSIERGVDQAWGAQNNQATTNPQQAIDKSWNKNPIDVPGAPAKKTS